MVVEGIISKPESCSDMSISVEVWGVLYLLGDANNGRGASVGRGG